MLLDSRLKQPLVSFSQFIGPSDGAHSAVPLCVYCLRCSPFVQPWFWFLNWALQSWNHPTIVLWADKKCVSVERDSVDRSHTGHWNKNERVFSVLAPVIWQTTVHTQIHTLTERTTHIFTQMNIPAELQSHSVTVTSNICSPTHSSCSLPVSLPVAEW